MVAQLRVSLLLLNRLCEEWEGTAVKGSRYGGPHWAPRPVGTAPTLSSAVPLIISPVSACACVCVCVRYKKKNQDEVDCAR